VNSPQFAGKWSNHPALKSAIANRARMTNYKQTKYLVIRPSNVIVFGGESYMPNRTAAIQTNKGTIRFELLESDAPKTTENFITLAQRGYYDGVIFHRVIKGFMVQGGDPTGTGRGGESAWGGRFNDEIDSSSALYQRGYKKGTVAMANAGPNTNGSQFFIMHADYPLPPSYTIFGRVTDGLDVVDTIATTQTDRSDKPISEVKMEKVTIEGAPE
jgi:cyclophilin family peptidyl-prolyl cis-trans isomerase